MGEESKGSKPNIVPFFGSRSKLECTRRCQNENGPVKYSGASLRSWVVIFDIKDRLNRYCAC